MSRLFKSQQCRETLPCRLEPVDMDSFFINEPEPVREEAPNDSAATESADPEAFIRAQLNQAEETVKKAQQQAEEIVAQARSQADNLIAQAKREGNILAEQARQEGKRSGWQEGHDQARQEWAAHLATALSLVEQGEVAKRERIMESEPEILRLAMAVAEKIIGAELELAPLQKLKIVREALGYVSTANNILIRVCPADQILLAENLTYLQEVFNAPKPFETLSDPTLREGNFFIETEFGTVDPRIKQQLERVTIEILKAGSA